LPKSNSPSLIQLDQPNIANLQREVKQGTQQFKAIVAANDAYARLDFLPPILSAMTHLYNTQRHKQSIYDTENN